MAKHRATMMEPPVETLLEKVDSKFTLVSLSAKRARQINSYFNQLGEGLGSIVPPQVASVSRKPLSIALEEIAENKIVPVPLEVESEADGADGKPVEVVGKLAAKATEGK
jgi:DNA-directed RNA polymerase subunit omega